MKRMIFITLFSALILNKMSGQSVDGVPLDSINSPYIMLIGTPNFLAVGIQIGIDFGQKSNSVMRKKEYDLLDEKGQRMKFNSMIDALNYLHKFGYRFKNRNAENNETNVYSYILEKEISIMKNEK
jgi:hypothetical protein